MNNDNVNDLSGLSREELLQLVAAQQSQIRSQQQQQQQQQLAWLGQAQRLSAAGALFQAPALGGSTAAAGALASLLGGARSAAPDLSHLTGAAPASAGGSLADLIRRRGAASELQDPGANANANAAEILQVQDPLANTVRQLMLRQELLGSAAGAAAGPAFGSAASAASQVSAFPPPGSSEDRMLSRLIGGDGVRRPPTATLITKDPSQRLYRASRQGGVSITSEHLLGASARALPGTTASSAQDPPDAREEDKTSKPMAKGAAAAASKKKTKRPLSAYNIFFKEEHAKIIAQNEREKAEKIARGEPIVSSDDDYSIEEDEHGNKTGRKRKRSLSTNQPGKRGKRQVDFENLTKVIGRRWKELPKERIEEYKRRAEEAMQAYRKNLFQKIRNSVKEDQC